MSALRATAVCSGSLEQTGGLRRRKMAVFSVFQEYAVRDMET